MHSSADPSNNHLMMEQNDELLRSKELSKYAVTYDVTEESFDQIAKMVIQLLNTPIGGISLVDSSHIWLKARIGVELSCIARDGSFCARAVDSNQDFFEVEDTHKDPYFAQNPLVTSRGIRFYAAAPLMSKGYCLGTLWIMDNKPRKLTHSDIILMQGLASQVCRLLDVRYHFELTGFPNLSKFKQNMQAIINVINNSQQTQLGGDATKDLETSSEVKKVAFGFLKIHGIHRINKLFGRQATNTLIKDFSVMLQQWLGDGNYHAQINFSKFAFALFVESYIDLAKKLEDLQKFLTGLFPIEETQIRLLATVGISLFPDHGVNVTSLLEQAENAGLNIESSHHSSVRIFTLSDDEEIKIVADLNRDIEQQLDNRNIELYFQPQVNFLTAELIGLEALACWKHPDFGFIPAERFIPLAEKNGLIYKLDLRIFRESCQALRSWLDQGFKVVPISNNFSRITLLHPGVMEEINKIINEFSIPRDKIEIEITESGLIERTETLKLIANQLHLMGLRVSIDDFGTGLSNISSLQSFKFDRIKIDRQFIKNISVNPYIEGIFHFIKGISEVYKVELICEGLDNPEDLEVLERAGVGCVQGWLFSPSLPKEQIPAILKRFNMSENERKRLLANPLLMSEMFKLDSGSH